MAELRNTTWAASSGRHNPGARARARRLAAQRRLAELEKIRRRLAERAPMGPDEVANAARAANEARIRAYEAWTSSLLARRALTARTTPVIPR